MSGNAKDAANCSSVDGNQLVHALNYNPSMGPSSVNWVPEDH